jgi:ankyrin repeat protein
MNSDDDFGLTKNMQAAARGDIEALKAVHDRDELFEERNPYTNANLLHYAAQAVKGGAEIIRWAILEANAPIELLSQRILVRKEGRDEGNGHTVAMEAAFNRTADVIEALIDISRSHSEVDLTTPALTGWTPRGFALREKLSFADKLPPENQTYQKAWDKQKEYAQQQDKEWVSQHPDDEAAIELAVALRKYVMEGDSSESIRKLLDDSGVDVNKRYGRLGQPLLNLVPTGLSASGLLADQQLRYAEVVNLLLDKGADPTIKETGLMRVSAGFRDAVFGYRDGLARMIEEVRKRMEPQEFIDERGIMNGYTRLIDAALHGQTKVVNLLLDYGADKNIKGFNGRTAYDAAVTYNNMVMIPGDVLDRLRT